MRNGYTTLPTEPTQDDARSSRLGRNPTYNEDPSVVKALPHAPLLPTLICTLLASLGGVSFGYDQGCISNILLMPSFVTFFSHPSPVVIGILTSSLELGALFGSYLIFVYGDSRDRSYFLSLGSIIFLFGSVIQTLAFSFSSMLAGRTIGGVGVGMLSAITPVYISEVSPKRLRGVLGSLEQGSIVGGVVLGFFVAYATREMQGSVSWRLPLAVQGVSGVVLVVACLGGWVTPSPRWLIGKGRMDDAGNVLRGLRGAEGQEELEELLASLAPTSHEEEQDLWHPRYRPRTLIAVLIMFFQQWSGINALLYYGPTLLLSLGFPEDSALWLSAIVPITQLIAVFPAMMMIDSARVGRRALLGWGSVGMALSHFVVVFSPSLSSLPIYAFLAFTLSYGLSFGPIGWVLPSEVLPLHLRAKGVSVATMTNWANNFVVGLITPVMVDKVGVGVAFAVFGCACVAAGLWVKRWVVETRGKGLEEVARIFDERWESTQDGLV